MEFELNKKYQLKRDRIDKFIDYDSANEKLLLSIDLRLPFIVLSLNKGSVTHLETHSGEEWGYNDFDLSSLIDAEEVEFFEEVKDACINSDKVILVMTTDTISKNSGVINATMAADMIKEFLTNNLGGKVEVFELTKTAQVDLNIVYK